jgi:cytochrome c oxidase assembly factor 4
MDKSSSSHQVHGRIVKHEDSDEDPVELMLKKAGCLEKHYKVQECIAETKDWRQCQGHVEAFRICMEEHKKKN